jgi:hypothetical protein
VNSKNFVVQGKPGITDESGGKIEMPERLTRLGILVGVDGSANSEEAVRWAADEAVMRNIPLALVHVLPTPEGGWQGWGVVNDGQRNISSPSPSQRNWSW